MERPVSRATTGSTSSSKSHPWAISAYGGYVRQEVGVAVGGVDQPKL
jgi:hypothetical protein